MKTQTFGDTRTLNFRGTVMLGVHWCVWLLSHTVSALVCVWSQSISSFFVC
jgi:hypothetical protein